MTEAHFSKLKDESPVNYVKVREDQQKNWPDYEPLPKLAKCPGPWPCPHYVHRSTDDIAARNEIPRG